MSAVVKIEDDAALPSAAGDTRKESRCKTVEDAKAARMMSIGLHAPVIGRPARNRAPETGQSQFTAQKDIWTVPRHDITAGWTEDQGDAE